MHRRFPRHTPSNESLIRRLTGLVEGQIAEMEARQEARRELPRTLERAINALEALGNNKTYPRAGKQP